MRFLKLLYPVTIISCSWMAFTCSYSRGRGTPGNFGFLCSAEDCMVSLNAKTETQDDSRTITEITKLNIFQFDRG